MLYKFLISIGLFFIVTTSQAQLNLQIEVGVEGDVMWSNSPSQIQSGPVFVSINKYEKRDFRLTAGANVNLWLNEWIGLNYEFYLGADTRYGFQFNTGWGQVAAAYLLKDGISTELGAGLVVICALLPEGVIFNIPVNDDLTLQPYLNPLESDYLHLARDKFNFAGEVGLKFQYQLGAVISIRPKLGLRYQYAQKRVGVTVGLGFVFVDTGA
jgi:hypothetical protein